MALSDGRVYKVLIGGEKMNIFKLFEVSGYIIGNIFETAQVYGSDNEKIKVCIDNNYYQTFDKKWWNSPYEINTEI